VRHSDRLRFQPYWQQEPILQATSIYHKEYEAFLNSLRELGVVDIVVKQQGAAENAELQDNIRLSARLAAALKLLQNQKHGKDAVIATHGGSAERGLQVLDEIDALQTEHSKLLQQQQICGKEKDALEAWGDFEPGGIQRLKDAGYVVGFYTCPEGNYKEEWEAEYNAMVICRISSKVFFVTVTKDGEEVDLDVEQAKLPSQSLAQLEMQYTNTGIALEENEKKLVALSETDIPSLKGGFVILKLYSHLVYLLFFPILIYQFLLDIHFFRTEIFAEQSPCHIQHFCRIQIDVDSKQLIGVVLGKS
jgi:V/A-type H+/Na+-transporting ATPase subunit I